jgi:hypothetical protein
VDGVNARWRSEAGAAAFILFVMWGQCVVGLAEDRDEYYAQLAGVQGTVMVTRCDETGQPASRDHYTCHGHFRTDDGREIAEVEFPSWDPFAEGSRERMVVRDLASTQAYHVSETKVWPYTVLGITVIPPVLGAAYLLRRIRRGERHGVRGHPGTESN